MRYSKFSNITIGRDDHPDSLFKQFDFFVVGSDQVWKPHYYFFAGKCDFFTFSKDSQKISYVASFGVSEKSPERKEEYAEYLKSFKTISVKENQEVRIVKDLADREATVVLDPTLLLDENDWRKVEKKSYCCPRHKYVFI